MKTKKKYLILAIIALLCLMGCGKDYSIVVSSQDLRFGLQSERQTVIVNANCKWKVTKNDDVDWYTVSPMSGKANDSIITVSVKDYNGGDFRGSSFVISSPGGHVNRTVFVSQNKLDVYSMINKVYGLAFLEQWNTDYYGQIIEDEYKHFEYNPYDTTTGQQMFFFEEGQGMQRRVKNDTVVYYSFDYEYVPDSSILHITFCLEDSTFESYSPEVVCASDSLYRVFHEYKPSWWERADMRKIGIINPTEKAILMRNATKRKKGGPIFITD